jgi:hypothetical protein
MEAGKTREEILRKVMAYFSLTKEQAEAMLDRYY